MRLTGLSVAGVPGVPGAFARLGVAVAVSAFVIFLYRAVPSVGQGYTYWAIDRLKFDAEFLGLDFRPSPLLAESGKGFSRGLKLGAVAGSRDHRRLADGKPLLGTF